MKLIIALISCFALAVSCNNAPIDKIVQSMMGQEVIIPTTLTLYSKNTELDATNNEFLTKLIVYLDSTECSSCAFNSMYIWEKLLIYSKTSKNKLDIIFIAAPKEEDTTHVVNSIISNNDDCPIYLDKHHDFSKTNSFIPKDNKFHTFLLDKNNKIIMIGNPTKSDKLFQLLHKKITEQEYQNSQTKNLNQ